MITKQMTFYSNTYRLAASLYLPDDYKEGNKLPCLVACSGYMGLNVIYPALFARGMTPKGYAVFGFDYRGFLDNEGPAGVCKLEEQVEDIRNAVAFCTTLPEVKADSILLYAYEKYDYRVRGIAERIKNFGTVTGIELRFENVDASLNLLPDRTLKVYDFIYSTKR